MRRSALIAISMALAVTIGPPGGQSAAPAPAPGPAAPEAGRSHTVTLVTGDVVTVHAKGAGCPLVTVRPAEPSGTYTKSCGPDGHVRVIPGSVADQIGTALDEDLFDVTTLIEEGYDDGHSKDTPLIIESAGSASLRGAKRSLSSVDAVAGRQPKTAKLAVPADARVWLDHKIKASALDANLTQIGAPRAWSSGYTGKGVRVAVLDTGVDATHPDLAGRILAKEDFTVAGGDAVDRFGHGTHVAATIAGTGAAAHGERRGVAPDAKLLVGKVLGDDGQGFESQLIAGMEWAAPQAKVVNLSLGGDYSDGSDPMSYALDQLSERYGTLFVVAAGNVGPSAASITSPGAAASALTVGAVDADDNLADFSSRGPVPGTNAAKPEIVAPGVDIVAARGAGTSMGRLIDAQYTALSGTSMATPHVAGAAADLAQRHPDWTGAQLKAALIGAADPVMGANAYQAGAGRLDIPGAFSDVVADQGVVNLIGDEAELSWTNTGTSPVRLALATEGAITLDTDVLTVPAGDNAGTVVRLDRSKLADQSGHHSATVTTSTGQRTVVAFTIEPPSYDLTVTATAEGLVNVINTDDSSVYSDAVSVEPGTPVTLRVPAGRYSVVGSLSDQERSILAGDPEVTVDKDTTVALDAAAAQPVRAAVDGVPTGYLFVAIAYVQTPRKGLPWFLDAYAWGDEAGTAVYATPMEASSFQSYEVFGLDAPGDGPSPYQYDLIRTLPAGRIPDDLTYRVTAAERATLARIDQRFYRLDVPETATSHTRYGLSPEGVLIGQTDTTNLPANRTDYVSPGIRWTDEAFYDGVIDYGVVTQEPFYAYPAGSRPEKTWIRQPLRPDWYDAPELSLSDCQPVPVRRTRGNLHVELVDMADQHQRLDCLGYGDQWTEQTTRKLTLYRNNSKIGEYADSFGDFPIPAQAGSYRLTYDLDASALLPVSTKVSTSWTFKSAAPAGTTSAPVPLLSVDYGLPLDVDNHPTTGKAVFTVRQAHGVATQAITAFKLWTSTDDGATWHAVPVRCTGDGVFAASLGRPAPGQAVSLRIEAKGDGGSGIEQTIIRAYR